MKDSGAFVISLDFELLWRVRDKRTIADYGANILGVRRAISASAALVRFAVPPLVAPDDLGLPLPTAYGGVSGKIGRPRMALNPRFSGPLRLDLGECGRYIRLTLRQAVSFACSERPPS
jgi:hypothetical protein